MDIVTYALAKRMSQNCTGGPIEGDQAQSIKNEIREVKKDIEAIKEDLRDNVEASPLEYDFQILE